MILQNFGCRVEVAANGREALKSLDALPFDMIFMDCEMPEMDGYEATAAIRARGDSISAIPIVAVTAKATKGDIERCLETGMDDYMSKPVRPESFQAALERWIPDNKKNTDVESAPEQPVQDASQDSVAIEPALDVEVVAQLRSLAEATDASLLNQIFEAFLSDGFVRLEALRTALAQGDVETLRTAAHALKGASANIGANGMAALAHELQSLGELGTVENAEALVIGLEAEFARVRAEIDTALEPS
jgi:CheY-like chemotaxis protein/HPt (histidine-containing phosphotransfer) domain-containing protein